MYELELIFGDDESSEVHSDRGLAQEIDNGRDGDLHLTAYGSPLRPVLLFRVRLHSYPQNGDDWRTIDRRPVMLGASQ